MMKRKILVWLLCFVVLAALPVTAYADIGPKPSVRITFTGVDGETFYGTLLSKNRSTGPSSAWDGKSEYFHYAYGDEGYEIWKKFVQYQDPDGYYFLQEWWECSEDGQLNWTYYPPNPFKILLYFPETDAFYTSGVYERYAFDSYYTVDLSQLTRQPLMAEENYDYTWEIISLVARILLTIALELGIALVFGYRGKRVLVFFTVVNVITQVLLNVALNVINYTSGSMAFTFAYVLLELVVLAAEAAAYSAMAHRYTGAPARRGKALGYALAANICSFAAGLWLAHIIPGIF